MNGYGYQWRLSASCCRAEQVEAGDYAPTCAGSNPTGWFWIVVAAAGAAALLWPARKRAA